MKLYLLGAPYLELDGEPVSIDTRKAIALLAYIVMTAAGGAHSHTRDALAALLWPDLDQSRARAALRRTLSPLRQAVDRRVLDVTRETVSIKPDAPLWVDAIEFRRLLSAAASHSHGEGDACHDCRKRLEKAVDLYGDDFMAGFTLRDAPDFDEWHYFESEQFGRSLAEALEQLTQTYVQSGDYEQAIAVSRRHLSLDPLAEQAHRNLMQLYAWSGQRSMAVRQYRECVRVLEQELGVPPLKETTALYDLILADQLSEPQRPQNRTQIFMINADKKQESKKISVNQRPISRRPSSAVDSLPLIGREREWARMQSAYDLARERGHFLVVEGEAGVGKTRLAQEFVAQAPGRVLYARCYEGESSLTFSPFIGALRQALENAPQGWRERVPEHWLAEAARLLPEIDLNATPPEPLTGPGAQSRFFEAVCLVVLALSFDRQKPVRSPDPNPGILLLDDVHWADAASLDLLAYLVKRLANHSLLVLVTWRTDALPAAPRLLTLLSGAQRANAGTQLVLQRLNTEQVEKLVEASTAQTLAQTLAPAPATHTFAQRLYQETEGLPFFVVEYLKAALSFEAAYEEGAGQALVDGDRRSDSSPRTDHVSSWEMPPGVRSLLQERLEGLDEVSWQLLNAAAVIGRSFDFDTCRLASGRSEEEAVVALEVLLNRGLIEEVSATTLTSSETTAAPQYDFSHNQIRALVYGETSLVRRRLLHRRVADALVQAPSRSLHATAYGGVAGQIAHNYRLAGQDAQAADYFRRAGEHARELYANSAALGHLRAALALGHPDLAGLHEAIGDLHTFLGAYPDALSSYEAAAAHATTDHQAQLEHKLGNVHDRRGEWRLADSHFQAALAYAQTTHTPADTVDDNGGVRARIYADWSLTAHHQGQAQKALSLAQEARQLASLANDEAALAQVHNILGVLARHAGDLQEAQRHLQRSLALATDAGLPSARIAALNNLALVYGETQAHGDQAPRDQAADAKARATLEEALQLCQELGDRHREAALLNNLADLHHAVGRSGEAMAHLKRAAAIFAEIGGDMEAWQPEIWKLTEW